MNDLSVKLKERFPLYLKNLRANAPQEWHLLVVKFRKRLIPWLKNKSPQAYAGMVQGRDQFVEMVFEDCLFKFAELLQTGEFHNYEDLEATIVSVAKFKLKEGYARLKKENRYLVMDAAELNTLREESHFADGEEDRRRQAMIDEVKVQMNKLSADEKDLLSRFYNGEELRDIAERLGISAAACRKRKQKALDQLREFVFHALKTVSLWLLTTMT
ncbi:MAG: sigma factor-like helix-turn-helix DNA-binding protein [Bacteroidota bacterium]